MLKNRRRIRKNIISEKVVHVKIPCAGIWKALLQISCRYLYQDEENYYRYVVTLSYIRTYIPYIHEYLKMMSMQMCIRDWYNFMYPIRIYDLNAHNRAHLLDLLRFLLPFINQEHASPFVAGSNGDSLKVAPTSQNILYVLHRIGVLEPLQQREVPHIGSSQSPRSVSVTSPRLRLDDDHFRQLAGPSQKPLQTVVAVIQVNPHGDREAEHHVESRFIKLRQIPPQRLAAVLGQKV